MNTLQILSFVGFTLLVAVITWWKLRKADTGSQQGYFLAGRSLKAPVIAASLMLTNLSTEQLVGLTGQAYRSGMSVMAWEVISAIPLIFLALIFLPRYLQRGIATIPDFIEERYDKTTRIIIDCCFLIATGICFLPIILYSGALAFNSMFHVTETFGLSQHMAIWLMAVVLGICGILYAVVGGMRAIAIADVINGIGLVIGGLLVPLFGLMAMGNGSLSDGITRLTQDHSQMLNSIGGSNDPVPIGAALTGLILVNTFYWCTNQGIVQRTLASKSLSEGQKRGTADSGTENAGPADSGTARCDRVSSVSGPAKGGYGLSGTGEQSNAIATDWLFQCGAFRCHYQRFLWFSEQRFDVV